MQTPVTTGRPERPARQPGWRAAAKRSGWPAGLLAAVALWTLASPAGADAVELSCGDRIIEDTTLTADLHCDDGAPTVPRPDGTDSHASILIAADNVTLDLNGHGISSYTGSAISMYGRIGVTIRDGRAWGIELHDTTDSHIHGVQTGGSFGEGILLRGSNRNRIERNRVRSEAGIGLANSNDNQVADNDIHAGAGALVLYHSARNRIEHNTLCGAMGGPLWTENADDNLFKANLVPAAGPHDEFWPYCFGLDGHGFEIGPDSTGNRLIENNVSGVKEARDDLGYDDRNGDGIRVHSPGNFLAANSANDNDRYGINAVPGNQSSMNFATGNGDPAQCLNVICWPGTDGPGPAGPPTPAGPRPAPTPAQPADPDRTAPRARLRRLQSQRLRRSIRLNLRALTEDLWASATASIRIAGTARVRSIATTEEDYIAAGDTGTVKLRLRERLRGRIARALNRSRSVRVMLTVRVRDEAGNSRRKQHALKLTR